MSHPFFERHKALLEQALDAIAKRGYWSAFPESPSPKVYGEGAAEAGKAAFEALLDRLGEKPACRTMVGLLALAHERACEADRKSVV